MSSSKTDTKSCIVITGASGFVGRHVIAAMLRRGWQVRALTREPDRLSAVHHKNLDIVAWDLTEPRHHVSVLEGAQVVCHAAAYIPPRFEDPSFVSTCFEVNTVGTTHLLEAASQVEIERFINLSSGNAYRPGEQAAREDDPLYPHRKAPYYLASKAAADAIADYYRLVRNLPVATLRIPAVYGPHMPEQGFLPLCIRRMAAGETIELQNGGQYRVDWVFVEDVVDAIWLAIDKKASGPFNISGGTSYSLLEVAQAVATVLRRGEENIHVLPREETAISGFRVLNILKARQILGFAPTDFHTGIQKTCEWMLS